MEGSKPPKLGKILANIGWGLLVVAVALWILDLPWGQEQFQEYTYRQLIFYSAIMFLLLGYFPKLVAFLLVVLAILNVIGFGITPDGWDYKAIPWFGYVTIGVTLLLSYGVNKIPKA
jgi:vacuolar-type H+-ATPase subunit I/STV1